MENIMLDFNKEGKVSLDNKQNDSLTNKIKSSINNEISAKSARNASFITLASVLSACNFGGSSDSVAPLNITAIKAPLDGALGFVDRNGDGIFNAGEEKAITDSSGSASINLNSAVTSSDKVVITSIKAGDVIDGVTYNKATVDTGTGAAVEDLVLKAPADFAVVTPVTTVVAETGLSEAQVKDVLGLPANMDVKTFNPFKENKTAEEETIALAAEKVALKVHTTISTIQASAKGAGLDLADAFATAIEAVADVVKEQSNAGLKADLSDTAVIDKVVAKTSTKMTEKLIAKGVDAVTAAANVKAADAVLVSAKAQIATINATTDAITKFDKNEFGALAKLADKSKKEAAEAVTAEKANPGAGAAKFTMKDAEAVKSAKETAKKEVEAATGESASSTTTTSSSAAADTPFVIQSGSKVDWSITTSAGAASTAITSAMSPDATYTVSGSTMTINLGQKFALKTVQDLLTEKADLSFGLTLASLPTVDDTTPNTTTVTITEGSDGTISSGEGQIKASVKSTYKATSSTQTDFTFDAGDPISISYTPRSGNSDVNVTITNPSANTYSVGNDGTFNNNGGQAVMELMATKFFTKLDSYDSGNAWAKNNILSKFVTSNTPAVHLSLNVADLGLYNGSTKINTVETVLNINDNPTVGGDVKAGDQTSAAVMRTGSQLAFTDISDLDVIDGTVTYKWEVASTKGGTYGAPGTTADAAKQTYTIATSDKDKFIKATYSYTDKQGNSYSKEWISDSAVVANSAPTGTLKVTGNTGVGDTLTAVADFTDADKKSDVNNLDANGKPATVTYKWLSGTNTDGTTGYTAITGATKSTYEVQTTDIGKFITVEASYTDDYNGTEVVSAVLNSSLISYNGTAAVRSADKAAPTYIYAKTITKSADAHKIGVYLDYSELKAADGDHDGDPSNANVDWTKLVSYQWDIRLDESMGVGAKWSDYFDGNGKTDYTGTLFTQDRSNSFLANKTVGNATDYAANNTLALAGAEISKDYLSATKDELLHELTFNPKDAKVGDTVKFEVTGTSYYGYDGTTGQKFDFAANPYTFDIIL